MDIYILRDGAQIGPFSEETTQRLLKQGSVLLTDMAWTQDMPQWIPLQNVLYPVQPGTTPPPPPPPLQSAPAPETVAAPAPAAPAAAVSSEPATPRQKAFLSYMGLPFGDNIGKEEAALLMHNAMENPKDAARVAKWNDDRLRLHPELFAAEIQAKKDSRSQKFFDLAHTMGADCFDGLTKAHAQVLVGYLDVKFPNWDANETEAAWNYFFPAVAEKFPDVVREEWRDRLKYPTGPKVSAALKGRRASQKITKKQSSLSPFYALCKGLVIGILTLLIIVGGLWGYKNPDIVSALVKKSGVEGMVKATKIVMVSGASPAPTTTPAPTAPSPELAANDAGLTPADPAMTPDAGATPAAPTAPAAPSESAPAEMTAPAPSEAAAPAATPPARPATPAKPQSSLDSLFGPPAGSSPMAPSAPAAGSAEATPAAPTAPTAPVAPTAPASKTTVTLTRAVDANLAFGRAKIPAGTQLKIVSRDATSVKVSYLNTVVTIPLAATDLQAP